MSVAISIFNVHFMLPLAISQQGLRIKFNLPLFTMLCLSKELASNLMDTFNITLTQ